MDQEGQPGSVAGDAAMNAVRAEAGALELGAELLRLPVGEEALTDFTVIELLPVPLFQGDQGGAARAQDAGDLRQRPLDPRPRRMQQAGRRPDPVEAAIGEGQLIEAVVDEAGARFGLPRERQQLLA